MDKRRAWYRSYEEMGNDPKFRVVAKRAAAVIPGVRASDALAVWTQLLCRASEATDRGSIEGYDCESADLHFDLPEGAACAIVKAFEDKGMILDGRIVKWDERQPKREDGSAERGKRWREEQKRTQTNADERDRTLDKTRQDKKRDKTEEPPSEVAPSDKSAAAVSSPAEVFITIPVNGPDEHPVTTNDLREYQALYGNIDVEAALRKMRGHWLSKAKNQRKTLKGIRTSINTWLARDNDKAVPRGSPAAIVAAPRTYRDQQFEERERFAQELKRKMGLADDRHQDGHGGAECFELTPAPQPALFSR